MYQDFLFPLFLPVLVTAHQSDNVINFLQFGILKTTESSFVPDGESENATASEVNTPSVDGKNTPSVDGKNPFYFYFYISKLYCHLLKNIYGNLKYLLKPHLLTFYQKSNHCGKVNKIFLG